MESIDRQMKSSSNWYIEGDVELNSKVFHWTHRQRDLIVSRQEPIHHREGKRGERTHGRVDETNNNTYRRLISCFFDEAKNLLRFYCFLLFHESFLPSSLSFFFIHKTLFQCFFRGLKTPRKAILIVVELEIWDFEYETTISRLTSCSLRPTKRRTHCLYMMNTWWEKHSGWQLFQWTFFLPKSFWRKSPGGVYWFLV